MVTDVAIDARGLGFDSGAGLIGQCRQRLVATAAFFRSCIAQALSRGNGPRHSLHASA